MPSDGGQHARADLLAVMKREHHVRPIGTKKNAMRTGLPNDPPTASRERREHVKLSRLANGSRREQSLEIRNAITVIEAIS